MSLIGFDCLVGAFSLVSLLLALSGRSNPNFCPILQLAILRIVISVESTVLTPPRGGLGEVFRGRFSS